VQTYEINMLTNDHTNEKSVKITSHW